jgi:Domain of unknown function (DUF4189)
MRRLYVLTASAVIATLLIALTMSTVSAQGVSKRHGAIAAVPSLVSGVDGYGATLKQAKSAAIEECRKFASHRRKYAGDCQGAVWVRNGWIAIAFERTVEQPYRDLAWGSGWGHTKDSAKYQARTVCRQYAQEKCEVKSTYETPVRDPSLGSKGGSW